MDEEKGQPGSWGRKSFHTDAWVGIQSKDLQEGCWEESWGGELMSVVLGQCEQHLKFAWSSSWTSSSHLLAPYWVSGSDHSPWVRQSGMRELLLPEWVTARHSEGTATGGIQVYKAMAALALSLPFLPNILCAHVALSSRRHAHSLRYKFDGAAKWIQRP